MKFGEKLKSLRNNKKMTQDEVASAIGVSRRAYVAYEQDNTRPRKQETYEKLADVLGCDVNYLRIEDSVTGTVGAFAAVAALGTMIGSLGAATPVGMAAAMAAYLGIRNANMKHSSDKSEPEEHLTYTNDMLFQYEKRQKRFQAIAMGVLYKAAAEKGLVCQHGDLNDIDNVGVKPDDRIIVVGNNINDWWLIFWAKDEKLDEHIIVFPEDRAGVLFSRFTTSKPDPRRKASIVVDDPELYEAVLKFKEHNSYRGNMSVILVDTDTISVAKEDIVSTYYVDEDCENSCFSVV